MRPEIDHPKAPLTEPGPSACRPQAVTSGTQACDTEDMRTSYVGPAVVLIDVTEHAVDANLWSDIDLVEARPGEYVKGLTSWGGTLTGLDGDALWELQESDDNCRIQIGDREGEFLPEAGSLNGGPLRISGSGQAPFDS